MMEQDKSPTTLFKRVFKSEILWNGIITRRSLTVWSISVLEDQGPQAPLNNQKFAKKKTGFPLFGLKLEIVWIWKGRAFKCSSSHFDWSEPFSCLDIGKTGGASLPPFYRLRGFSGSGASWAHPLPRAASQDKSVCNLGIITGRIGVGAPCCPFSASGRDSQTQV